MDKLKMHSPNLTQDNIARIRELFPGCVTEAENDDGNIRFAVDFDQLRQELSDSLVEGPQERYHLDWPGKRQALLTANAPIAKTLRPYPKESLNFDTTQNLFIEGDNLDALKLLQETYLGKVKMIYIDPPYNTGNDFVYEDDFAENTEEFLKRSNQKNEFGHRLVANLESNGRFHSDWLSMTYPRLKLARNLLSDEGIIFASIDDREQENFKKLFDEIFGESNFVATIIWERAYSPVNLKKHFSENHDFIMCYAKNIESAINHGMSRNEEANQRYLNPDNDPRGAWKSSDLSVGPVVQDKVYEIVTPTGRKTLPPNGYCWRLTRQRFEEFRRDNRIWFGNDGNAVPSIKRFLSEVKESITPMTIWKYKDVGHSQEARQELKKLFDGKAIFDYPKPVGLISRCCELYTSDQDIIIDFYAGSCTTAHSVMQLNSKDGYNRKFVMIQLPEPCDIKSEAYKAGYKTIAEIGKDRIRRAGKKILEGTCHKNWNRDVGFRVLKVDTSNMEDVYYTPDNTRQDFLSQITSNIKPDRSPEDLLFQVLLDWGVELSLPIRKQTIDGKNVFFVDENALVACFDKGINEALVKKLTDFQPLRVVFTDGSFVSDAVKINVEQIFRQLSPGTEVKTI